MSSQPPRRTLRWGGQGTKQDGRISAFHPISPPLWPRLAMSGLRTPRLGPRKTGPPADLSMLVGALQLTATICDAGKAPDEAPVLPPSREGDDRCGGRRYFTNMEPFGKVGNVGPNRR
jgi:hypothetical protein